MRFLLTHALTAAVACGLTLAIAAGINDTRAPDGTGAVTAQAVDVRVARNARAAPWNVARRNANRNAPDSRPGSEPPRVEPSAQANASSAGNAPAAPGASNEAQLQKAYAEHARALLAGLEAKDDKKVDGFYVSRAYDRQFAYGAIATILRRLLEILHTNVKEEERYIDSAPRNSAMRLLGTVGAVKALPDLVRDIEFVSQGVSRGDVLSGYPAGDALAEIGAGALPGIYDYLRKTPRAKLSDEKMRIFAYVLWYIYGAIGRDVRGGYDEVAEARKDLGEILRDEPAESNLYRLYDALAALRG